MNQASNPEGVFPPQSTYMHTVKVPAGADWLVISGQVGLTPEGRIAGGARAQAEQVFANILGCLKAHGMDKQDLVKMTTYVTDSRYIAELREVRDQFFGDITPPTSTLLVVDALAASDWVVEIEAWAAK